MIKQLTESVCEPFIDPVPLGQILQLFDSLLWQPALVGLVASLPQPLRVQLAVVHHINVRAIDGMDVALARVGTERRCAVDAGDCDAVARLHGVHQVVVGVDQDGVRRLTGRHVLCNGRNI